jgi:hypothetical protein
MSTSLTVLHVQGFQPEDVEQALAAIFASEERTQALRLEGTYSAVLARVLDPALPAAYRYLLCRPHPASRWTPLLELGNRTVGLEVELSRRLDGAAVFTVFVYGDVVSGYRLARDGRDVDSYVSDPEAFDDEGPAETGTAPTRERDVEALRGHPERFADLLPPGTDPQDVVRVVLRPGWWEAHEMSASAPAEDEEEDVVDEVDRMRCLGLALELWGPSDYPFAQDPEEIPNRLAGPGIALAFA